MAWGAHMHYPTYISLYTACTIPLVHISTTTQATCTLQEYLCTTAYVTLHGHLLPKSPGYLTREPLTKCTDSSKWVCLSKQYRQPQMGTCKPYHRLLYTDALLVLAQDHTWASLDDCTCPSRWITFINGSTTWVPSKWQQHSHLRASPKTH